jgi:23S rRNA pseudouridine1911/1915/1917 synthase
LACFPKTGRQHQIRVHADLAGYPLVGDKIYGMTDDEVFSLLDGHREFLKSEVSPEPIDGESVIRMRTMTEDESDIGNLGEEDFSMGEEEFEVPGPTSEIYAELGSRLILPRHALHAAGLKFVHPKTGQEMAFEADLPDDLRLFFEKLTDQAIQPFKTKHWD